MYKSMAHSTQSEEVGDRREWILRLLYTPDEQGRSKAIYGKTRLMKASFLLDRKLREVFDFESDFEFEAHKYGPFDRKVYTTTEQLEAEGLIRILEDEDHDAKYDGVEFSLTPTGKETAADLFDSLSSDKRDLLYWVKYKQSMRPLGALLSYVYTKYPEYTTESVLV